MSTMTKRQAGLRVLGAALVVAAGNLLGAWLATAAITSETHPLSGPLAVMASVLVAGLILRRVAGWQAPGTALVLAAAVLAAAHLLLPEHLELLRRLLPVLGGAAGGVMVVQAGPACRGSLAS